MWGKGKDDRLAFLRLAEAPQGVGPDLKGNTEKVQQAESEDS